jgi:hypothetical protein
MRLTKPPRHSQDKQTTAPKAWLLQLAEYLFVMNANVETLDMWYHDISNRIVPSTAPCSGNKRTHLLAELLFFWLLLWLGSV